MVEDLSRRHDLVGGLFAPPRSRAEWDRYRRGMTNDPQLMVYPPGSLGEAWVLTSRDI